MYVQVGHKNGKPCVQLRKTFTKPEEIEMIVTGAMWDNTLQILPIFKDKLTSLGSLIKNGILYKDKSGQYKFTVVK